MTLRTCGLVLAALVAVLAGCRGLGPGLPATSGLTVFNDLDAPVSISYVRDGREVSLAEERRGDVIQPGREGFFRLGLEPDECTTGDVVIRLLDGREYGRIPRFCQPAHVKVSDWNNDRPSS